jgi:hypothetical protein
LEDRRLLMQKWADMIDSIAGVGEVIINTPFSHKSAND